MRPGSRSINSKALARQRLRQISSKFLPQTYGRVTASEVEPMVASTAQHHLFSTSVLQNTRPRAMIETTPAKGGCSGIARIPHMAATSGHQEACCNIPPVIDTDYTPKGSYEQIGGLKTYVTGPKDATIGVVCIYDIFGYMSQTIQGVDILATGSQKRKVFMADWANGEPVPSEWFPPDTEEKQKHLGDWFNSHSPGTIAAALPEHVKALQAANPSITSWAIIGYCWGGKVTELVTSAGSNLFQAAAAVHPAMIDPAGADNVSVPYMLIASGDDPDADVKAFESRLKVPNHVETFADQVHGFMAGRADLSNSRVKEEYTRGYKELDAFFAKHLHQS